MEHLEYLHLEWMAIKELPASIENLISVKTIELGNCKNLATLPSSIYKLKNLKFLNINHCWNFVMFPKNLKDSIDPDGDLGFQNLEALWLDGCNLSDIEFLESSCFPKLAYLYLSSSKFTHLPTWIIKYDSWRGWFLYERKRLPEIPRLPSKMGITEANSCNFLHRLPDSSSLPSDCFEVDLSSCGKSKSDNVADMSSLEKVPKTRVIDVILSGREMPEWILHCKEGFISFMVPRDLYDKFLGLALCFAFGSKEGIRGDSCPLQISVNNGPVFEDSTGLQRLESDRVWLHYLPRSRMIGVEELMQNDWSHFQVHFRASEVSLEKCGFRLICEQQEDDLRVRIPRPSADAKKLEIQGKRLRGRQFSVYAEEEDSPVKWDSIKKMRYDLNRAGLWGSARTNHDTGVGLQNMPIESVPTC